MASSSSSSSSQQQHASAGEFYSNRAKELKPNSLQDRKKGPSYPLKSFHNEIKLSLLREFAYGVPRLLDLACGRGGDIRKWSLCHVKNVVGVDISKEEIEEIHRRIQFLEGKNESLSFHGEFLVSDKLGVEECKFGEDFDVVTCMFALQYFFHSESTARMLMRNVSLNLKNEGYFIGCFPDGEFVLRLLNNRDKFVKEMVSIKKRWIDPPSTFGSGYCFSLKDTITEGDSQPFEVLEYLVFLDEVLKLAKEFHLYPILSYKNKDLKRHFYHCDSSKPFKHFYPPFKQSPNGLHQASSLYVSFVFQKRLPS